MKMQYSPIGDGALQATTPAPTFKPITVELTFETLEELLVLTHAIGSASGNDIKESIEGFRGVSLSAHICSKINYEQYKFFNGIADNLAPSKY